MKDISVSFATTALIQVLNIATGLLAARQLHDDGIRLNFTLGFSARQNWLIASTQKCVQHYP